MPTIEIPFGDFLPSLPEFKNPGCVVADNCIPSAGGAYRPFARPERTATVAPGRVLSAEQVLRSGNPAITVGGTSTRLFVVLETGITRVNHPQINALDETRDRWMFAQFNNILIATAPNNTPKYLRNVSGSGDDVDTWFDLPGNPPSMSRGGRVGDFMVLGNADDNESQIAWSSFNNPVGPWAADRLTQAGNAVIDPTFGGIQRIVGGRYALLFQQRAIHRMSYVGPPTVWQIDPISENRGGLTANGIVDVGYLVYFLADDGFFVTNGSTFVPIGNERVNQWFFDTVNQSRIASVEGIADFERSLIMWAFSSGNEIQRHDRVLIYSWLFDRWSTATLQADAYVRATSPEQNMDTDPLASMNLDELDQSLDSDAFRERANISAVWLEEQVNNMTISRLHLLNGEPMQATWETGEFEPSPARRVFIDEVYPIIDNREWSAEASLIVQGNRGVERTTPARRSGINGFCPVHGEGQRMRIRVEQPTGFWNDAQGVQVRYQQAGMR